MAKSRTPDLKSAHQSPDFRKPCGKFDDLTDRIDPHLYEVAQVLDALKGSVDSGSFRLGIDDGVSPAAYQWAAPASPYGVVARCAS